MNNFFNFRSEYQCYIGIDPSITCTAVTCINSDKISSTYFTDVKKHTKIFNDSFIAINYSKNLKKEDKITFNNNLTESIVNVVKEYSINFNNILVTIEGYSYSSKGKVFDLAEFIGLLKYKLKIVNGFEINIISPSEIKMFILKGNSNKTELFNAFNSFHSSKMPIFWWENLSKYISDCGFRTDTIDTPLGDILDSIYTTLYSINPPIKKRHKNTIKKNPRKKKVNNS